MNHKFVPAHFWHLPTTLWLQCVTERQEGNSKSQQIIDYSVKVWVKIPCLQNVWVKNTHLRTAIHSTYFLMQTCLKLGDNPKTQGKIPNMFSTMGFKMVMLRLLRPPRFQPSACDAWAAPLLRQVTGYAARFGFQCAEDPQSNRWWSFLWHWPESIATDPLERVAWIPSENMEKIWIHSDIRSPCNLHESVWLVWVTHTWTVDALIVSHVLCTFQYLTITSHLQSHSYGFLFQSRLGFHTTVVKLNTDVVPK